MTPNSSLARDCCQALVSILGPQKVSFPGSESYDASLASYFTPQVVAVPPLCIVSPETANEVSAVVVSLTAKSCEFAIRSGGHSTVPNASNAPDGVTVDLRALSSMELSEDNSILSVGVGVTWDEVYAKLDPLGLGAAGGRVGGVGVPGLTLGGGISYFGPRNGWTCDTAVGFEVVLADGSIVEVDEAHDPEFMHGLRGGMNNFGIVTRIQYKTFKQDLLWTSSVYSPLSSIDEQVKVFADITAAENYDDYASFIFGFGYSQSRDLSVIIHELVYTKPTENPTYYQGFLDLPSIYDSSSIISTSSLAVKNAGQLPIGKARYAFSTTTFTPTEAMTHAVFKAWNASLEGVRDIQGLNWSISMEPVPPSLYQGGAATNALGLSDRKKTLIVCLLTLTWANATDDERLNNAQMTLIHAIEKAAKTLGTYDPFKYINYAAQWQDPITGYGEASIERLQKLRERVDPRGVFTRLVSGGFKIPP
ncbi:putative oxidoreductase [Xylaria nigripes]|nr:putative oxidoreductase [Xylaria nigripes]